MVVIPGMLFSYPNFYFGCEADDPMTATAFKSEWYPNNVKFNAMFGSDIGHWDVSDMTEVLEEAFELVDDGLITDADFRDFTFSNAVSLHAGMNPSFFEGTAVEKEVVVAMAR